MSPIFGWIGLLVIIIGVAIMTYSVSHTTVERNGKPVHSVHGIYIAVGFIMLVVGIILVFFAFRSIKNPQKGFIYIEAPKEQGNKLHDVIEQAHDQYGIARPATWKLAYKGFEDEINKIVKMSESSGNSITSIVKNEVSKVD